MNDDFMHSLKREPRRAFAEQLYQRIDKPMNTNRTGFARWTPLAAAAAALMLAVALFSFPPAQAWAQDFLNQFRIKRFTAISVDPARMQQMSATKFDMQSLVGKDVQVVQNAGEPQAITLDAARALSGMRVRVPGALPYDMTVADVRLQGEGIVKMTADAEKLQSLLDTFGISDVKAPAKLNGAPITIHTPVNVTMSLRGSRFSATLVQARSPEVTLPEGVALRDLGLIGLRLIGFSAADAKQFAQTIDWNATLVVPVPANAATFREVSVGSGKGLIISSTGPSPRPGDPQRAENLLLWSDGDMIFAISGTLSSSDLMTIADGLK